jgi:hypothetical protein
VTYAVQIYLTLAVMTFYKHLHALHVIYNIFHDLPFTVICTFRRFILNGLQIRRVAPRIKIHHMDHEVDRSINIVRPKQVFEPYCMMFKVLKGGGGGVSHHSVSAKKRKKTGFVGGGGGYLFTDFCFLRGVLKPNPGRE